MGTNGDLISAQTLVTKMQHGSFRYSVSIGFNSQQQKQTGTFGLVLGPIGSDPTGLDSTKQKYLRIVPVVVRLYQSVVFLNVLS